MTTNIQKKNSEKNCALKEAVHQLVCKLNDYARMSRLNNYRPNNSYERITCCMRSKLQA